MPNSDYFQTRDQDGLLIIDLLVQSLSGVGIQEDLSDPLVEVASNSDSRKVLVNFSAVKLVSSDAIGAFIRLRKEVKGDGGEIKLFGMNSNVHLSFRLLNLDGTMFEILETEPEAIASFSS